MSTNYIAPIWRMPRNANNVDNKLSNYSINFNGSTDYIEISNSVGVNNILSGLENFSISVWYNARTLPTDGSPFEDKAILGAWSSGVTQMLLYWDDPDGWRFLMNNGTTSYDVIWGTATTTNEWHHIVVTFDGSTISFYHDNNTPVTDAGLGPIRTQTAPWRIGVDTSSTRYWDGELSQFCLFDYALSTDQVDDLYNLENPMIIDGGEPIQYLPLGDNSNPNAPGSFPNISVGADSVFDFDGNSTYIDLGTASKTDFNFTGPFTLSAWAKKTGTGAGALPTLFNSPKNPQGQSGYILCEHVNRWKFYVFDSGTSNWKVSQADTTIVNDSWYNITAIYDGSIIKLYVNGDLQADTETVTGVQYTGVNQNAFIGEYANSHFNGEICNVQLWDTDLSSQISTIYNNGQPLMTGTQPQEANLKAWYKLNQSANYDSGIGPWDIEIVGTPNYSGTADGCYTTGTALRYADTNDQTTGSGNYFRWLTPLISCQGTIDITHTLGGEYVRASSGVQLTFQYQKDGGGWVTYHNELVPSSSSTTPVTFTITSATGLSCNNNIRVRVLGAGGLFNASYIEFYNIKIAAGAKTFYEQNFNSYSSLIGYNNGNVFNQSQVGNYIDPVWQIPDAVSAYPQSFNFSKTPQEYIDLGKDDWFNDYNNEITFSFWINKKDWSSTGFEGLISKYGTSGSTIQYRIAYPSSAGKLQFYLQGSATSGSGYSARIKTITLTSAQQASEWLHIIWRHDASTNRSEAIFNGDYTNAISLTSTNASQDIAGNPYAQPQITTTNMIGNVSNGLQPFDGAISNYQRFNSYLDNAAVEALYNNGVPSTTAIANSQAWYKLDNTELFDSTNWSVENQKYPANFDSALDFNGTSDSFSIASPYSTLANKSAFTLSFWFKQIDFLYNRTVLHQGNGIRFSTTTNRKLSGSIYTFTSKSLSSNTFNENEWQHFMLIYDGSSLKLYQNGDVVDTDTGVSGNTPNVTGLFAWASHVNLSSNHNECQISNIAVWDTDQTTEVSNIYNNGTPATSYTNTPNNWYKLDNTTTGIEDAGSAGNNGTNNGATKVNTFVSTEAGTSSGMTEQNLVNNNVSVLNGESSGMNSTNLVTSNISRTQPYSNYSFNFDAAASDYISIPNPGSIFAYGETAFTFSGWVSIDAYSDQDGIFARFQDTNNRATLKLGFTSPFNGLMFQTVDSGANGYLNWNGILPNPANGEWKHICLTYASGTVKLYLDGVDQGAGTPTGTIPSTMPNLGTSTQLEIARDQQNFGARLLNGRTSNFCVFDRALTESEILKIYNNGVTQDLQDTSSFSNNILGWWPMDQRSSYYDGTDWVVRDLEGGKDGNGINTGNVEDMVGSAPGSEANGSGISLAIENLKGNMYNSDKNAYSINMADYADGVTNPANSGRSTDTP